MSWQIKEAELSPTDPDVLATVFCVGNGHVCTRGTLSEQRLDAFRGTYVSGLYTRSPRGLVYFMGAPDWLPALIWIGGEGATCVESTRSLDMKTGVLRREAVFESAGTSVAFREERLVSFARRNLAAQRVQVSRLGGDAAYEVVLGLDGEIRQSRAKYYRPGQFPNCDDTGLKLAVIEELEAEGDRLKVVLLSRQTQRHACAIARVTQTAGDPVPVVAEASDGRAQLVWSVHGDQTGDGPAVFEKICAIAGDVLDFERATAEAEAAFVSAAGMAYDRVREESTSALQSFWETADVEIRGDPNAQRSVRFAVWATRIAAADDDGASSLGAKNLTGDWYRGGVFWDMEIFQLPMLAAVAPRLARNHVLYRCRRLDAARRLAAQDGYRGARYVGCSFDTGLEDPPAVGGLGALEIHVSFEVAWCIRHYYYLTGDAELMLQTALEVLVEITNFWASRVTREADGSYHLREICGPDELHKPVDDNAYKNRMIAELMSETERLVRHFRDLDKGRVEDILARTGTDTATGALWRDVSENMHVPMIDELLIEQYTGFRDVPEPDRALVKKQGMGADKIGKQADTLLLFQNIPWEYSLEQLAVNYAEYAPLCNQTSSLSFCTHALLAAKLGLEKDTRRYFELAEDVDLGDSMGNTAHGVHGAGQGGIWLAVVQGIGGLAVAPDGVCVDPRLPLWWEHMRYRFLLRGNRVEVRVCARGFEVENMGPGEVTLSLGGQPAAPLGVGATSGISRESVWRGQELEGVILDLDGVLVSTDRYHYAAWKSLADELGIPFGEEENHQLRGVSREESLKRIYGSRPLPAAEDFQAQCARKNERYVELIRKMTPDEVLPGAIEFLTALRAAGIRCAVASASKNCGTVLDRTGLAKHCDAIVDGTCVTKSKPDPQGFLIASQRLRALPWNCIGVEDAESGIEAIHRAGMLAVSIGEQARGGDLTVASVAELSVDALQELFGGKENPVNPYLERNIAIARAEAGE